MKKRMVCLVGLLIVDQARAARSQGSDEIKAVCSQSGTHTDVRRSGNVYCAGGGMLMIAEVGGRYFALNRIARAAAKNPNGLAVLKNDRWSPVMDPGTSHEERERAGISMDQILDLLRKASDLCR